MVNASDAFAEAHGRAEEALTELLEERGRCLREAAASVRNIRRGLSCKKHGQLSKPDAAMAQSV